MLTEDCDWFVELHSSFMLLSGMQQTTVAARRSILTQLCKARGNLLEATRADVMKFIGRPELKDASRGVYLAHVRSFYNWAEDEGYVEENPCRKVKAPKRRNGVPRPMPTDDLILAVAQARPTVRVWLMLGAFAGLRCIEMSRLTGEDLILSAETPHMIVHGKGGHRATVPLHPVLVSELRQWKRPGYLFSHKVRPSEHVSAHSVSKAINDHLRKLGINHTAHSTRHLFATVAYRESGHDLLLTRNLLRHSSVSTTQIYAQTDPVDAADVVLGLKYGLLEENLTA